MVLSKFGITLAYRYESAFSAMKGIKSKKRNRITEPNLMYCVLAATTKYKPSFKNLVYNKQCRGSLYTRLGLYIKAHYISVLRGQAVMSSANGLVACRETPVRFCCEESYTIVD